MTDQDHVKPEGRYGEPAQGTTRKSDRNEQGEADDKVRRLDFVRVELIRRRFKDQPYAGITGDPNNRARAKGRTSRIGPSNPVNRVDDSRPETVGAADDEQGCEKLISRHRA